MFDKIEFFIFQNHYPYGYEFPESRIYNVFSWSLLFLEMFVRILKNYINYLLRYFC